MFELRVAVGMRRAFPRLLQGLQPVAERSQQPPDRRGADGPAVRGQRRRELRAALARPAQRRRRIAAREWLHQQIQRLRDARLRLFNAGAPGARPANASRVASRRWPTPSPRANRGPRQPRGRGHDRVAAVAHRRRLGRRPQAPPTFIKHRRHHHELGHQQRFEIRIARHCTPLDHRQRQLRS